jgi:transposase InsO family protein
MQDIMYRFGMPNRIITDLGSPFTAIKFRSWAQDCSININYASIAHPQANDQVERANGLLVAGLKPRLFDELKIAASTLTMPPLLILKQTTRSNGLTGYW